MGTRLRFVYASVALAVAASGVASSGASSGCSSYGGEEEAKGPPSTPDATDGVSPEGGCPTGTAECDSRSETVCETKTDTDPSNCGYCGRACPARANAFPRCAASDCTIGCNTGFADCNANADDGCETPVSNDPVNCGACGRSCLGAQCAEGLCVPSTLAGTGAGAVASMAVGESNLYVGGNGGVGGIGGDIRSMTKAGLKPQVIFAGNGARVQTLAVASGWIWASNGNIVRCDEATCGESGTFSPFKITTNQYGAFAFAFDDKNMFAAPVDTFPGPSLIHAGPRVPVDGGFTKISETPALAIAMDVSSTHVFVQNNYGRLSAVPIGGGDAGPPTSFDGGLTGIRATGSMLVYRNPSGVFTCVAPQCTAVTELVPAATRGAPVGVDVGGTDVYVAFEGNASNGYIDGSIVRCPLAGCGGTPFVLAKAQLQPSAIVVDATHVFWGRNDGAVLRVAK